MAGQDDAKTSLPIDQLKTKSGEAVLHWLPRGQGHSRQEAEALLKGSSLPDRFCIEILQLNGSSVQIEVSGQSTVHEVKLLIGSHLDIPVWCQELALDEKLLTDSDTTLQDFGVANGSLLTLLLCAGEAQEAIEALKQLNDSDVSQVAEMAEPPMPVMIVCTCVMYLKPLGTEDAAAGWAGCKAMLKHPNFLSALWQYKKHTLSMWTKLRLVAFIEEAGKDTSTLAGSKCGQALWLWLRAVMA
eukprot:TRINITY_DN91397_c0_g1_i1.p1 TRINITY_DN91397_c0_g1~~TRINITY_DN91397_c0_g1_i1.p1  ORF type:complete len:243 (-),score=52.58 TRINITY_DN91397_c0_g1_i1:235-963(-)